MMVINGKYKIIEIAKDAKMKEIATDAQMKENKGMKTMKAI
jgi:hypothetical protein